MFVFVCLFVVVCFVFKSGKGESWTVQSPHHFLSSLSSPI